MKIWIVGHPGAKKTLVKKDLLGDMHVYVQTPPLQGKANLAITRAVAKHFKVKNSAVEMIKGFKSKRKLLVVDL